MLFAQDATSTLSESLIGFPQFMVSRSASSSAFSRMSCAHFNITFLRSCGAISLHTPASNVRLATATARFTSSTSPSATCAITDPSRGLMDSKVFPLAESTNFPSINNWVRATFWPARLVQSAVVSAFAMGIFSLSLFVKRKNRISKRSASRLPAWKRARF